MRFQPNVRIGLGRFEGSQPGDQTRMLKGDRSVKHRYKMSAIIGIVAFSTAFAAADKGAENIILFGGKTGEVPFPHAAHQNALEDCNVCHTLFPQRAGIVETLKREGKLKKKQLMKQCQSCHRKMKKTGEKTGPTRCKACHSG